MIQDSDDNIKSSPLLYSGDPTALKFRLGSVEHPAERKPAYERLLEALKFCEHRYSKVPGMGPLAAYACDRDGRIVLFNARATELWGRMPEDENAFWCGSLRLLRLDGPLIPHAECYLAETLRERRPVFGEDILVERPDGSRVRVSPQPEPVFDPQGMLVGAINVLLEVKEPSELDQQFKLRPAMLDHVGQSVIYTDIAGKIQYWNRAATRMYGWTSDDAIGRNVVDVIVPQMAQEQAAAIMESLAEGQPWSGEFLVQHKNGRRFSAHVTNAPVTDEKGQLTGIIGVSLDLEPAKSADRVLREVENRHEQLFNAMGEGVVFGEMIYDEAGNPHDFRYLDLNPAVGEHLGFKKEEVIGRTLRDFVREPNLESLHHYDQVVRTGEPAKFDFFSRELGKHFDVIAYHTSQGRFAAILQDVTASKKSLEALRASEDRFRGLFQAISGGVVVQNANGAIIEANQEASRIVGLSADQLMGLTSLDPRWHVIHEDGRLCPGEEHPAAVTLRTGQPVRGMVLGVYCPAEGEYRWVVANSQPVFKGDSCTLEAVVINFVDITPLRRAEEALFESQALFTAFMDNLPGFAWIKHFDGRYKYLNKTALKTLRPGQDWRGKPASELWPPAIAAKFVSTDQSVIEGGTLLQTVQSGHDPERDYLVTKFPIVGKNAESSFICGLALDSAEMQKLVDELRKNHQSLEKANERLEAEVSKISEEELRRLGQDLHDDICQNLAAISLLSGELAASLANTDENASRLAERIERMICDALKDSRSLARGLHPVTLETRGLTEALRELAARASVKVPCQLELSDSVFRRTGSVALGLYRIAQEAVSNSIKYSEARRIVIALHHTDGQLVLEVTDNGRGNCSGSRDGMGLHIMQYRARIMGGKLVISNAENGGTRVTCRVPDDTLTRLEGR